jgi:hypothetical protein
MSASHAVQKRLTRIFADRSSVQLKVRLMEFTEELPLIAMRSSGGFKPAWLVSVEKLHSQSQLELNAANTETAWKLHKHAQRLRMHGFTDQERHHRAVLLAQEVGSAGKLSSWRRDAVRVLLGCTKDAPETPAVRIGVNELIEAQRLIDEQHDNQYRKLAILRSRLILLSLAAFLVVGGWIALVPFPSLPQTTSSLLPKNAPLAWGCVVAAALLGAVISGFTSTLTAGVRQRIPLELAQTAVTLGRFALAAVSGIAAILLLRSGFLNLGALTEYGELGLAVAAGFSERYLLKALSGGGTAS